jgi:hypothetical protein
MKAAEPQSRQMHSYVKIRRELCSVGELTKPEEAKEEEDEKSEKRRDSLIISPTWVAPAVEPIAT